jgi:hypothetical protein
MKKQLGVTLTGLLMVSVVLIFVLLLGFKVFTPITEFLAIQKIFKTLSHNPEVRAGGKREFIQAWAGYAQIENVSAIGGDDIEITKEGGNVTISASYQKKVPLFKNVSLLIDFNPSSAASQ